MKMRWWHIIGVVILGFFGWWLYRSVTVVAPGAPVEDQGRQHVSPADVISFAYNSNPPTSGPHLPTWVKAGVYQVPQSEGELIHSLEHGYIIISYNCGVHLGDNKTIRQSEGKNTRVSFLQSAIFRSVYAHEEGTASMAGDFEAPAIATGSAITDSAGCQELVKKLEDLAGRKKLWKLIVVPRPQLDTTLALTAWGAIDKFDPAAGELDEERIVRFIDYYRDHGPEKTME